MSGPEDQLLAQLESLRAEFDRSFAAPRAARESAGEYLLAIRVGRDPYALRAGEIGMIGVDRPITALPSTSPELCGIAGVRGALVAVYDLASLIGAARSEAPRWLACAKGSDLAFAFDAFEGQVRVVPADLSRSESASSGLLAEVARVDGVARPVIPLLVLVTLLDRRERAGAADKELSS